VKHNLTENQRVLDFAEALKDKDYSKAGEILYASHTSLKDDFQVSCKELDTIVEIARNCEGVYGCRMTGAGFGGCAIALVQPDKTNDFIEKITQIYRDKTNLDPVCYISPPAAGASIITTN
jgi:galactokinase